MHCNKPKTRQLLAVPEMFTIWTPDSHITRTVYESVNFSGVPL